jgi:Family of unknown function (DUF5372)
MGMMRGPICVQSIPENSSRNCTAFSVTAPSRAGGQVKARSQVVCDSCQNADALAASPHLVRITHPFHPFSGRQLVCVGERYNRAGRRLLLRVDDRTICSVPPQWTDIAAPDPEVLLGQGRALFRVADLVELARLMTRLSAKRRSVIPVECKDKSAAIVNRIMPL